MSNISTHSFLIKVLFALVGIYLTPFAGAKEYISPNRQNTAWLSTTEIHIKSNQTKTILSIERGFTDHLLGWTGNSKILVGIETGSHWSALVTYHLDQGEIESDAYGPDETTAPPMNYGLIKVKLEMATVDCTFLIAYLDKHFRQRWFVLYSFALNTGSGKIEQACWEKISAKKAIGYFEYLGGRCRVVNGARQPKGE